MSVPGALACGPGLALLLQMAPPDSVLLSFLLGSVIEGPSWDTGAWAKGEFRGSPPVSDESGSFCFWGVIRSWVIAGIWLAQITSQHFHTSVFLVLDSTPFYGKKKKNFELSGHRGNIHKRNKSHI